ncbi:MAG: hypothetical protein PHE27_00450, partial [Alphaproteobacteria bacterium]|nr:hypothetical protein [Alphaproteobacteria bacterium]
GLEAAAQGFTVGANYADNGRYNSVVGAAKKDQKMVGAGIKYEFNKVAVGFNYLGGDGYSGANFANDYVKEFSNYSLGGTYTWAPGLSTNVNGVLFNQKTDTGVKNDGYVLLLSQKLAFYSSND